ncbi:hypothetical protein F511_24492 [Dorcoceras hygrometricum]|uniref:Uncharacterized protein n=1 Tax=Dorcoceras hygrometricum TaxID=472368 RepID=A0A2Z7C239_9LAMI|nr:hypothetical protein F511_24492 [Dorcoceras hygrometricum]
MSYVSPSSSLEGITRRFDESRPSTNTRSRNQQLRELLVSPRQSKQMQLLVYNTCWRHRICCMTIIAKNDGDVMMSDILHWLTSSNLLKASEALLNLLLRKLLITHVARTVPKTNTVAKSGVSNDE